MKINTMILLNDHMSNDRIYFPDEGGVYASLTRKDMIQLVRTEFGYTSKKTRHLKKHFKRIIKELLKEIG